MPGGDDELDENDNVKYHMKSRISNMNKSLRCEETDYIN